jgi:hypothetical protein
MSTVSLRNRLRGLERERRAEMVDDPIGRGLRDAEERVKLAQRQVLRQYAVTGSTRPFRPGKQFSMTVVQAGCLLCP